MDSTQKNSKKLLIYTCKFCNFKSSNKNDYARHLITRKHLNNAEKNDLEHQRINRTYECKCCQKIYNSRNGLWYHEQKCIKPVVNEIVLENTIENIPLKDLEENKTNVDMMKEFMIEMFRSNNELRTVLLEIANEPKVINNITNVTQQNTQNNNNFNLQLFLNETCKDAITANQFANNIEVSMSDLHNVGIKGYVEGLSQIIINELRKMDITKRPFHCTDLKREVIYIKDADAWNKDNDDKSKLKLLIGKVARKNLNKLCQWQAEHQDLLTLDSDDYFMNHKLLFSSHGGDTELTVLKDKVIKLIAKEIHLDRTT